jgi:hypothetical protein
MRSLSNDKKQRQSMKLMRKKFYDQRETLSHYFAAGRPAGHSPCRYTESIVHVYKISVHMHDYNLTKSSLGQIKSCNGASCAAHSSGSLSLFYLWSARDGSECGYTRRGAGNCLCILWVYYFMYSRELHSCG